MLLVGNMLQEEFHVVNREVIDGVGEITNIVSGGVKNGLVGTPWSFSRITVPSVIVGQNYQIAFTQGLQYFAATFEVQDSESVMFQERLLQVAVSLFRS